jgi:predicted metal-dependent HD superfamily phosphohydrolase
MIKFEFFNSLKNYCDDEFKISSMWNEVEESYGKSNRHYHTITHLNKLVEELIPYKRKFTSWDVVVFAITYHDIVYHTLKKNNEEKSAVFAGNRLSSINVPEFQLPHASK